MQPSAGLTSHMTENYELTKTHSLLMFGSEPEGRGEAGPVRDVIGPAGKMPGMPDYQSSAVLYPLSLTTNYKLLLLITSDSCEPLLQQDPTASR